MNITPKFCIFSETFGTQSLFPIFVAIWSKIFVKIDWKPFFSRFEETVIWLLISIPDFNVILLSVLYWFLKFGGMMNQKILEALL